MRWTNLEPIIQSEVSQKEKIGTSHLLTTKLSSHGKAKEPEQPKQF